jgi:hypothetical protein
MALKTGTVDLDDTTTIVELLSLVDGTVQSIGWQGTAGAPSFEIYAAADGSGGAWPLNGGVGWSFAQGQILAGVTGSFYVRCTDLGGEASQPVSVLAWDAS